jgi:transposase-like protein
MNPCPYCHTTDNQLKVGKNDSGNQRWKCQACRRRYTPVPTEDGYPDSVRQLAIKLYVDGLNFRRIARHLGVDHKSVMNWVKAHSAQLPAAPVPDDINNAELDELFTFVGKKKTSSTS